MSVEPGNVKWGCAMRRKIRDDRREFLLRAVKPLFLHHNVVFVEMQRAMCTSGGEKALGRLIYFMQALAELFFNDHPFLRFKNFCDGKNSRRLDAQTTGAFFFREQTQHGRRCDEQRWLKFSEFLRQFFRRL